MSSPAPHEPMAPTESVRAVLAGLDADPKLEGKGLSEAFARSFPEPPEVCDVCLRACNTASGQHGHQAPNECAHTSPAMTRAD